MEIAFNFKIIPLRELIEKVEVKIDAAFAGRDRIVKEQTLMTIVELLDNAVKYGMSVPGIDGVDLHVAVTDSAVKIRVANSVDRAEHFDCVRRIVDEINRSEDPETLYVKRIKELMNGRVPGESRLGLYRIACEGGFGLSYECENNILAITAKKEFH